ncbi:MAG TPA: hypothetical protein VFW87_07625 [Pirellulales bacterium]|nr:hypothetical protein [Pirellulales bacterium]
MDANARRQTVEGNLARDRLEIIRFPSQEARIRAIDVLVACGKFNGSATDPNVWNVRTDVVRALLAEDVPFEWVTRNLP